MLAKLAKSKRHKDVEIAVPVPRQPKKVKRTGPTRPDEYLNEAAKKREAKAEAPAEPVEAAPPAAPEAAPAIEEAPAAHTPSHLALVEEMKPEPIAAPPPRPVQGASARPPEASRHDLELNLSERAREAAALTRVLKGDVGYYQTLLELRDAEGVVSLAHSAYAGLFALRIGAIAPLFVRLQELGALEVVREFDRRTQTTWAYRIAEPSALAAKAPPVKAP